MRSLQIYFVLFIFLARQNVESVVNNHHSTKSDDVTSVNSVSSEKPSTEPTAGTNRRVAPVENYESSIALDTSYFPSESSNQNLPVPVYGAPDAPSNNVLYPAPPPDIPPPLQQPTLAYGTPTAHPTQNFILPPITKHGTFNVKNIYNVPRFNYGPPRKYLQGSKHLSKHQSNFHGEHFQHTHNHNRGIDQFSSQFGGGIRYQYGPPQPSSYPRPPHPGVPAPPTPPDIKYDGWKPIPGLVSRVPSTSYKHRIPEKHIINDLNYNKDIVSPILDNHLDHHQSGADSIANLALEQSHGTPQQISDSYGAPLNTVTGSGGVVGSSGDEVHGKHILNSENSQIDHNNKFSSAQSYSNFKFGNDGYNSFKHHGSKGTSLSYSGIGLVPPSGVYGVPSSGLYGTSLLSNFNSFQKNPSRQPVIHKEPIPPSVFESIQRNSHNKYNSFNQGSTYLSPPASDVSKLILSNLHSLPNQHSSSFFHNSYHGADYQNGLEAVGIDFSHPGITIDFTQDLPHVQHQKAIPDCLKSSNELLAAPSIQTSYEVKEQASQKSYGTFDLDTAHSQKSSIAKNNDEDDVEQKAFGKAIAASIDPQSEIVRSQSIDINSAAFQEALGDYSLEIQSIDGSNQDSHQQVLNEALLKSILSAIEQPETDSVGKPIIQLQKSLEQDNFVTNDTISSVVNKLTDDEIRISAQLAKDAIDKTSGLSDSSVQYVVPIQEENEEELNYKSESKEEEENVTLPNFKNDVMALYFSNTEQVGKNKESNAIEDNATVAIS